MDRKRKGQLGYLAGAAAEDIVARAYDDRGCTTAARRWRGQGGEIDLIVRDGAQVIFVEVKKSASFAQAATRLTRRQMDRICMAACEFVGNEPRGMLTEMRFDLAMVDGRGDVQIIPNAFGGA